MENQDIQFTFDKKPVLSQSQQDSLNIKLKQIIILEQELGFVVPVLYTKPKGGTLFNLKQYVEDVNSRKGISKPEDYSAIGVFLNNNIIHLESMKNQKESQEVKEQPKKEETMNNQDNNKLAFTFSTEKLPEGYTLDKLNSKLNTIIELEESLGFEELMLHTHTTDKLSLDAKDMVSSWNQHESVTAFWYGVLVKKLDKTIDKLNQMVKESKQEVPEQPVECPEKEETSLKQPDVKFTFYKNIDISKEQEDHLNQKLSNIIHIEMDLLKFGSPVLYSKISNVGVLKLNEFVKTISELSCTITITYEEINSVLNYALDRLFKYLKK